MIPTPESATRLPGEADTGSGVLNALRVSTAERHELLHEIMPLSVESVALRDYLAHLAILRAWLEPIETWFKGFCDGPQSATLAARMNRLALIDADLSHGSIDPCDQIGALVSTAADHNWAGAQSAAYRWGVCYVIEGSQLGGAVLYARLKNRLAPHPLGFLDAGREALGPRWQAFVRTMSAEVQTPAMIDEACRGAADAFDRLIDLAQAPTRAGCANVV
ncbi:biliverdin-producing heme oxygenase [Paraburkholderia sp. BCC1884]|uniref:biliverdin-producing heme oxygenase n=1 Tax=Paraburkholderia sp. BCC1884 TaxID=2562668 RepID=UPI0021B3B5D1|nr:biliverdin-producing heme oxygenase [Paraburkholderia sp. BCC1884]